MAALCCDATRAYRNIRTDHESKFTSFLSWFGGYTDEAISSSELQGKNPSFIIQVVKQINFGRILSKRFFASSSGDGAQGFYEVNELFLINDNFEKLNTFKNYTCAAHNLFFELNVYGVNPRNKHHWRSDVARPAADIDL